MKDENSDNGETKVDAVSPDLRAFELSAETEDVRLQLEKASPEIKESFADELREFDRAFRAASTALEHSSFSAAVQLYEKALAKSAVVFEAASARDDFLAAQSEMEKAKKSAEEEDYFDCFFPEVYRAAEEEQKKADSLANGNDFKLAAKHARAAAKQFSALHGQNVAFGLKRAEGLKSAGKLAESFVLIEKVLVWEPENADAIAMKEAILDAAMKEEYSVSSEASHVHQPGEERIIFLWDNIPMVFCWCPATTSEEWKRISGGQDYFVMGDSTHGFRHVVLTKGFWMGKYVMTCGIFKMLGYWCYSDRSNEPLCQIDWSRCNKAVSRINEYNTRRGYRFALPTEAQWEYACRAGTTTEFSFGSTLTADEANFKGEDKDGCDCDAVPVGTYPPNAWGLHEMHGNLCEWCADWYAKYESPSGVRVTDPAGPKDPTGHKDEGEKILRGGGFMGTWRFCSSSSRRAELWGSRPIDAGFRLVCCED